MCRDRPDEGLPAVPQLELEWPVRAVEGDHCNLAVGPKEGCSLEAVDRGAHAVATAGRSGIRVAGVLRLALEPRCADHRRAEELRVRKDVLGEVTDEVVLGMVEQLPSGEVGHHRRVADVVDVVGPSMLVQEEVPVEPANAPSIEVADDVVGVALAEGPITSLQRGALVPPPTLVRRLTGKENRLWELALEVLELVEAVPAVPVERHAVHVLRRDWVRVRGVRPLVHVVLVVVVDEHEDLGVGLLQGWPKEVREELVGLSRGEDAALPLGVVLRLVLKGHGPDLDPVLFEGRDPLGEV
mmetsp:Transcript_33308/g.75483  ORF Transcript_33308/g.75483 Transcript_33308/m.75483 type:complete len:298 (-) Transcript_33308:174-1067(-)